MKAPTLSGLLLLAMLTGLATACDKDEADSDDTNCYKCTIIQSTTIPGFPDLEDETTAELETCGMTEQAKEAYENSGTYTATSTSGNVTVTISNKTTCIRK